MEILPKKIRATFHLTGRALASLGAAASAYHMVTPKMRYMIVGIAVGSVAVATSLLTWAFPETKALSLGNSLSRTLSRDGAFPSQDRHGEEASVASIAEETTAEETTASL